MLADGERKAQVFGRRATDRGGRSLLAVFSPTEDSQTLKVRMRALAAGLEATMPAGGIRLA
jgi:hypothetical protein